MGVHADRPHGPARHDRSPTEKQGFDLVVQPAHLVAVRTERLKLKADLAALEEKMDGYLKELGY